MRRHLLPTFTLLVVLSVHTGVSLAQSRAANDSLYTWIADLEHSSIQFRARHWGIVDVIGWFESFSAVLRAGGERFDQANVEAAVDLASVRMPNPEMAENLRNLVFEVSRFPTATFRSTHIKPSGARQFEVAGELVLHDISREVVLHARFNGFGIPPLSSPGFTIQGELRLSDFGLAPPEQVLENRAPTISDLVRFTINLRMEYTYK